MDRTAFERSVREVNWSELEGAYGPSDGSERRLGTLEDGTNLTTVLGDVPSALLAFVDSMDDNDSDAWMEAIDVIQSHVWHQGDIYAVTPEVLPFLFTLIREGDGAGRADLAGAVVVLSESARRYARSSDPAKKAIAARMVEVLEQHHEDLLAWSDADLADASALIGLEVPGLRPKLLARIEPKEKLEMGEWIALARLREPPGWVRARATEALELEDTATRIAAAVVLANAQPVAPEIAPRLEEILALGADAKLREAIDLPIELPAIPKVPLAPWGGDMVIVEVLFAGASLVTARVSETQNVTIRWPGSGLKAGDTMRVAVTRDGSPRAAEITRPDGTLERREFGPSGEPLTR